MNSILTLILKGFILGLSMVLPGLSGGTVAFLMGFYQKLLGEIAKFKLNHIKKFLLCLSLKKNERKQNLLFFFNNWDWLFLCSLGFGILFSVTLYIILASSLIEKYSLEFYSLVFGLVTASLWEPFEKIKKNKKNLILFLLSFLINLILFNLKLDIAFFLETKNFMNLGFIPIGFILSVALVVPGLSGSYLLVLFGLYEKTLFALKNINLSFLFCFFIGLVLGLFSTAKIIKKIFKRYYEESLAILLGLISGSLPEIYPLSKESLNLFFSFKQEDKIFFLFSISSFIIFMAFNLFLRNKRIQIYKK